MELLRVAIDADGYSLEAREHGLAAITLGDLRIQTETDGRLRLRFSRPLAERCISTGLRTGPPMINGLYNNNYEIVQTPDYVVLRTEMISHARIVPLNSSHKMQALAPLFGESVGFWEGDTLVVETTNFSPLQEEASISLSSSGRVLEKFTRVSDEQILYEFTVEDPKYYSQAWHGEGRFLATEGKVYEFACHEGNYALSGILAGARREEHDQQQ